MDEDADRALRALPAEELRRRVYAQGADEADERWIRAAAELARRERAARPATVEDVAEDAPADDADADAAAAADADADSAADDSPARASRRPLAWAAGALAVGLLVGTGVGAALGGGSPAATADATPSPGSDAPPVDSATAAAEDPDREQTLLGPESMADSRSRPVGAIFDTPQNEADQPPRTVRADVDPASIRGVQTSVGLYAGRTVAGDLCLLVFPDGGAGVITCASPEQVAADGLRIAWTTDFPSRQRDGSTGIITGDVEATWSTDDLITLTTPDRILAY